MSVGFPAVAVVGAAIELPATAMTADEAIRRGLADAEDQERVGVAHVPISNEAGAPRLAVLAAQRALGRGGVEAQALGAIFHAWTYHQGHDFWSPAHFIARSLGAMEAVPTGIQQMCDGGARALALAGAHLAMEPLRPVLVTTADIFAAPGFDRWRGDYGIWYGDSGTAVVLDSVARHPGAHRLLAVASRALPDAEAMHRGRDAFSFAPREHSTRIDVRRTKREYLAEHGRDHFAQMMVGATRSVLSEAFERAGVEPTASIVKAHYLPRVGRRNVAATYRTALSGRVAGEIIEPGEATGHLGAGDAIASIVDARNDSRYRPGDIVAHYSAGAGFTVSCTVLCVGDEPT